LESAPSFPQNSKQIDAAECPTSLNCQTCSNDFYSTPAEKLDDNVADSTSTTSRCFYST